MFMKPILQVEDDPNDIFLLQRAIKKTEVANPLQVATDGQQAIDYLQGTGKFADREKFPLPCLILLDLKLPYVMGLEVLKVIRRHPGNALAVIILTASSEESDIAAAYRLGANGYLTKPAQSAKLEEMVRAIKDFWLTHNTQPRESFPQSLADFMIERMAREGQPAALNSEQEPWPAGMNHHGLIGQPEHVPQKTRQISRG
jgi:CheY-like chemotaxis protein